MLKMRDKFRRRVLVGTSLAIVMCSAHQASAQTASDSSAEATTAGEGLDEIIVTAQRREERLRDVPIAVTAIGAETLARSGVTGTDALPQLIPSVQFTRSGTAGLFYVRGVGTSNAAAGEEGTNAVYIDGVYLADLTQTIMKFNNIERIEVLRGPQGTLFGRNATGGLIQVITRDPGDELTAFGDLGYANYGTATGRIYAGGPLSDKISMDVAAYGTHQRDGWGQNLTRGEDTRKYRGWGIRSKLVFRPSDDWTVKLAGDYSMYKDNSALAFRLEDGYVGSGGTTGPGGQNTTADGPALTRAHSEGVSLTIDGDIGFANVSSITAYRYSFTDTNFDVDAGPLPLIQLRPITGASSFQQELRLSSGPGGPLQWQVGAFYLRSVVEQEQTQRGAAFGALGGFDTSARMVTNSIAVFGETTYSVTPTTHLTAGLRYTRDHREFEGIQTAVNSGASTSQAIPELTYGKLTYRISLRQEFSDDVSVYGSVNKGFKAGLYSLAAPTAPPVKPQFIMAYEVGLKAQLFDQKLRVNLSAFHYDIDGLQIKSSSGNVGSSILLNAAKVKTNGVEAEFEAAPTKNLRLYGAVAVLDSKFDVFGGPGVLQAPIAYQSPAVCPLALVGSRDPGVPGPGPRTGGLTTCYGNVSGNTTPLAPKFSASLGGTWTIPLNMDRELRLNASYSYNSGYPFEADNVLKQSSYNLVNSSLQYQVNRNLGVELWANNIFDETYFVQKLSTPTGPISSEASPRTYGVSLKFQY